MRRRHPQIKCRPNTNFSELSNTLYSDPADNGQTCGMAPTISFSPDAPSPGSLSLTPVAARNTPYVTPPTNCWQNLGTGQVTCTATGSHGGLYPETLPFATMPIDSPLNRILTREPVGPWNLVGYASTNDAAGTSSRDRNLTVYAQSVDTRRDRYNYRVVDSNGVPLDIGDTVQWKMDGGSLSVPGQASDYTLHLYPNFK